MREDGVVWAFSHIAMRPTALPSRVYNHPEEAILAAEIDWQSKGRRGHPNWARHSVNTDLIYAEDYLVYPIRIAGEQ